MIGLGLLSGLVALVGLVITRKKRISLPKWVWTTAIWAAPLPVLGISLGWIFTEMGRQPWIVFGLLKTEDAVSPNVGVFEVSISLASFVAIYSVLAIVEFKILRRTAKAGPVEDEAENDDDKLAVAY